MCARSCFASLTYGSIWILFSMRSATQDSETLQGSPASFALRLLLATRPGGSLDTHWRSAALRLNRIRHRILRARN
jgi:hypothetical protein